MMDNSIDAIVKSALKLCSQGSDVCIVCEVVDTKKVDELLLKHLTSFNGIYNSCKKCVQITVNSVDYKIKVFTGRGVSRARLSGSLYENGSYWVVNDLILNTEVTK